jgi:hypothetical protein
VTRPLPLLLLPVVLSGCSDDDTSTPAQPSSEPRWLDDVEQPLPALLSEVGAFDPIDLRDPGVGIIPYEPRFPLFTNGLEKERLLFVPPGASIEPSESGWSFPEGTVLVKTFSLGAAPIETRLLFRRAAAWEYAEYVWRADGLEADLLEGNWPEQPVVLPDGTEHVIPARLDCRTCHETSEEVTGTPVLGISPLQTSEALAASAAFASPPEVEAVAGRTPAETAAFAYFIGNCLTCHTGGDGTNAAFSLFPADVVSETVGVPTEAETAEGIRVIAGDPEASVLFIGVVLAPRPDYEGPFKKMPPLGLTRVDPAAESILRAWIDEL